MSEFQPCDEQSLCNEPPEVTSYVAQQRDRYWLGSRALVLVSSAALLLSAGRLVDVINETREIQTVTAAPDGPCYAAWGVRPAQIPEGVAAACYETGIRNVSIAFVDFTDNPNSDVSSEGLSALAYRVATNMGFLTDAEVNLDISVSSATQKAKAELGKRNPKGCVDYTHPWTYGAFIASQQDPNMFSDDAVVVGLNPMPACKKYVDGVAENINNRAVEIFGVNFAKYESSDIGGTILHELGHALFDLGHAGALWIGEANSPENSMLLEKISGEHTFDLDNIFTNHMITYSEYGDGCNLMAAHCAIVGQHLLPVQKDMINKPGEAIGIESNVRVDIISSTPTIFTATQAKFVTGIFELPNTVEYTAKTPGSSCEESNDGFKRDDECETIPPEDVKIQFDQLGITLLPSGYADNDIVYGAIIHGIDSKSGTLIKIAEPFIDSYGGTNSVTYIVNGKSLKLTFNPDGTMTAQEG
jgi:hypothetical protein